MDRLSTGQQIKEKIDSRRDEIVKFCQKLVQIDSQVDPPTGHEGKIQEWLKDQLVEMGMRVDMWEPVEKDLLKYKGYRPGQKRDYTGRPNVVGVLPGRGKGKSLILNGHVDTVPIGAREAWTHDPLGGEIEEGKIFGRGASDMKSGIAAMIMAVKTLVELNINLRGDIIVECVVDEESTGNGTLACLGRGYVADAALIPEISDQQIVRGHRGILGLRITTYGQAGHASGRWIYVNAIDQMIKVQNFLQQLEKEWLISKTQYPFVPPSIAQTMIQGGTGFNVIPDVCTLTCDIKYLPQYVDQNGFGDAIKHEIEERIIMLAHSDPWMKDHPPSLDWITDANPCLIDADHPLIQTVKRAVQEVGKKGAVVVSPTCSDLRYFILNGIPGVWYGPGHYHQAHVADEYVSIDSLIEATKSITLFLIDWCGLTDS